jgi:hypothetical protein
VVHASTVHVRFGFALVLPVVEAAADRVGQGCGHVDEDVELPVLASGFEYEDLVVGICAEAIRHRATRGPSADHDVIPVFLGTSARQPRKST